jgi:predicted nuclease of predicted toxin-antitoxin system
MPKPFNLYLDQMFQIDVAQALRNEGHEVLRASEVGQSRADDQEILQKAIAGNRILVTLDKHFGDWVVLPLHKHPGVIRLKVNPTTSKNAIKLLLPFLRKHSPKQLKNCLVILSPKRSKWIRTT